MAEERQKGIKSGKVKGGRARKGYAQLTGGGGGRNVGRSGALGGGALRGRRSLGAAGYGNPGDRSGSAGGGG